VDVVVARIKVGLAGAAGAAGVAGAQVPNVKDSTSTSENNKLRKVDFMVFPLFIFEYRYKPSGTFRFLLSFSLNARIKKILEGKLPSH